MLVDVHAGSVRPSGIPPDDSVVADDSPWWVPQCAQDGISGFVRYIHEGDEICDLVGVTFEARYTAPRPGDVRDSLASIERAGELLGYEPAVAFREGLRQTIESFRETREPERG